jgi:MFS family permease
MNDERAPWHEKRQPAQQLNQNDVVEVTPLADVGVVLAETLSRPNVIELPPDGGTRAWLQVVGCIFMFFNVWGFTFAFGSFANYYEVIYIPETSQSAISWIGSIQAALLVTMGVVTGQLFDRGFFMSLIYTGAFLCSFAVMMLSLCTEFYQILLAQGVCIGIGAGMVFTPSMALIARSFKQRRAIAMGVVACGAPTGGILYTLMFEQLITKVGFAWTVRIMGFVVMALFALALPLLLWRSTNLGDIGNGAKRKLVDYAAFTDLPFWGYALSTSFLFMGYLTPFFFLPSFGVVQLGSSQSVALYALITSQAASVPGRLIVATCAHKFGIMICWVTCAGISATICLAWAGVDNIGGFFAICASYGFFSGPLIPLPTSIFPVVCPDTRLLGSRLGMAQLFSAAANLIGPPIAGALVSARKGPAREDRHHYLGVQLWAGLVMLVGTCMTCFLWIILIKKRHTKKMI